MNINDIAFTMYARNVFVFSHLLIQCLFHIILCNVCVLSVVKGDVKNSFLTNENVCCMPQGEKQCQKPVFLLWQS